MSYLSISLFSRILTTLSLSFLPTPHPTPLSPPNSFIHPSIHQSHRIASHRKTTIGSSEMRRAMMRAESRGTTTPSGRRVKEGHFLLPVLSTYAKENPPSLEMALNLIRDNAVRAAAAAVVGGTDGGGGEIGGGRKRPSSSTSRKKKKSPLMSDAAHDGASPS